MSRYPRHLFGPAGACDNCRKFCCVLSQAGAPGVPGIKCYRCRQGRFRHRADWKFGPCPECNGQLCPACDYGGVVIVSGPAPAIEPESLDQGRA